MTANWPRRVFKFQMASTLLVGCYQFWWRQHQPRWLSGPGASRSRPNAGTNGIVINAAAENYPQGQHWCRMWYSSMKLKFLARTFREILGCYAALVDIEVIELRLPVLPAFHSPRSGVIGTLKRYGALMNLVLDNAGGESSREEKITKDSKDAKRLYELRDPFEMRLQSCAKSGNAEPLETFSWNIWTRNQADQRRGRSSVFYKHQNKQRDHEEGTPE
ncbi:hypothetical protein B0T24DRAFT_598766 [Lasiosphaeria ovina]|uniref:Uncharacterized protein n=1 Tax=Lasiosphaeria ovina TaxID=92902 RepID=A0AAE0JUN4_9PEZI|nr:hypothetical protein B0T24DRAFT_598766 [Lasiosphaeria ovina]